MTSSLLESNTVQYIYMHTCSPEIPPTRSHAPRSLAASRPPPASRAAKRPRDASYTPETLSKTAQDASKTAQDASKT